MAFISIGKSLKGAKDYRQGLSEVQPLIMNTNKQTPTG